MVNFISQKAEVINYDVNNSLENKIKIIANVARTCYKSENIDDDFEKDKRLLENLIISKHFSMLEHAGYILYFNPQYSAFSTYLLAISNIETFFGKKLNLIATDNIISGNIRAWIEFYKKLNSMNKYYKENGHNKLYENILYPKCFKNNVFFDDVLNNSIYSCADKFNEIWDISNDDIPIHYKELLAHYRISARIICDRAISHELVRHRTFSFAQESTRYCNYNKKGLTFIDYSMFNRDENDRYLQMDFIHNSCSCAYNYSDLIDKGFEPQIARGELPHNLKTELVMTGNLRSWLNFFNLRYYARAGKPHPLIKDLSYQLIEDFERKLSFSEKIIDKWSEDLWREENE